MQVIAQQRFAAIITAAATKNVSRKLPDCPECHQIFHHSLRKAFLIMNKTLFGCLASLLFCTAAHAQTGKCIAQKMQVQKEQYYIDANGQPASRFVAPGNPVRGNELVYTILVRNQCATPAANVVIDIPLPPHVTYTKTTAKGDGTDRMFSIDQIHYGKWDTITVKLPDGSTRPVNVKDIKSIRWIFKQPIAAHQSMLLHFHAVAS